MATKKKPTAKQLAARKKFAQAAKDGTLAKKRAASNSKKKVKRLKSERVRRVGKGFDLERDFLRTVPKSTPAGRKKVNRTTRGKTIEAELKTLARDLGYDVVKRKPAKPKKKTAPKKAAKPKRAGTRRRLL